MGTILAPLNWRPLFSQHLSLILLGELCVYVYRDIAPLAIQHHIMDGKNIELAAVRIVLLFIGGVLVPITLPRTYRPVDPKVSYHLLLPVVNG